MNIYLLGYMYSGKTTIGRKLAECLDTRFVDLDQIFEEHYHTSIPLFFNRYSEDAFRKLEQLMLHSTHTLNHVVISTGGGTPCFFDNMEWINAHGISVYLNVGIETIIHRAQRSKKQRPILANKNSQELHDFIQAQLSQRLPYYSQAKIIFPADDPDIQALVKNIGTLG